MDIRKLWQISLSQSLFPLNVKILKSFLNNYTLIPRHDWYSYLKFNNVSYVTVIDLTWCSKRSFHRSIEILPRLARSREALLFRKLARPPFPLISLFFYNEEKKMCSEGRDAERHADRRRRAS